jgi:hypothetical protein
MAEGDGMDGTSGGVTSRTVFLSYASHDAEIANTVCRELESRGIRCWIAPRDVAPGALCPTGKVDFLPWADQHVNQLNFTPGLTAQYLVSSKERSLFLSAIKPQPKRHKRASRQNQFHRRIRRELP